MKILNKKHTIYLDMDGVVADFETAASNFLGSPYIDTLDGVNAHLYPASQWAQLSSIGDYFRHLPKMPHADQLMVLAKRFRDELNWDLYMLTAMPHDGTLPNGFQDKIDWMAFHYPGVRVRFGPYSKDKQNHCNPGDILVDDRLINCDQWTAVGGIAVQVTKSYTDALDKLQCIFNKTKKSLIN
jgi:hypothetical protein